MTDLGLHFDQKSFCRLFPFYFQISPDLKILNFGRSLSKTCTTIKKNDFFFDHFILKRPHIETSTFEEIKTYANNHVELEYLASKISFRGQLVYMNDSLIFVGTP